MGRGAQQTNLNLSMVRDYPVPIVNIERQKLFAEIGSQSDKSKFELKQAIADVDSLARALLQQELN